MTAQVCEELLATIAQLALGEARELAVEAERSRVIAAEARDGAAAALCEAGWSVRRIGAELGVSHTRAHQMVKAHRDRTWGGFSDDYSAIGTRAQLHQEYVVARHAQELRLEAAGAEPGTEERRRFFQHEEAPITFAAFMRHREEVA